MLTAANMETIFTPVNLAPSSDRLGVSFNFSQLSAVVKVLNKIAAPSNINAGHNPVSAVLGFKVDMSPVEGWTIDPVSPAQRNDMTELICASLARYNPASAGPYQQS